jgi:hypothetical protein
MWDLPHHKQRYARNRIPINYRTSVQRLARRVVGHDRCHPRSFAELITEPSPKLRVFDLLTSKPNGLAKKLSDALLGCALGAVMRYSLSEFRQHYLEGFFVFRAHVDEHEFSLSPIEASSAVKPNRYNLGERSIRRPFCETAMT